VTTEEKSEGGELALPSQWDGSGWAVPAHPGAVGLYLAQLAPGSRRTTLWRLERAAALLEIQGVVGWHLLTYPEAVAIRARAADRYSPRTASAIIAAVRAVCREAWRAGLMDGEAYRRIQSVPSVKGSSPPPGRWVSRGELRALFDICGPAPAGRRDAAMLALLFGAGLRRSELVGLDLRDVEQEAVVVREGKGRKARRVPVERAVVEAVSSWSFGLMTTEQLPAWSAPLLRSVDKGGRVGGRRLTGEAIRRRLLVLCKRSGVDTFTPHDGRRSYASGLLDSGADLAVVARLLGHSSVQVTAGYDRRGARAESEAAGLVRLPYAPAPGTHGSDPGSAPSSEDPPEGIQEPGPGGAPPPDGTRL
jgi:integrase